MRNDDKLYEKIGRDTGMKVPDGYFDDFVKQMMQKLPEYPERPVAHKLTVWQRVKPYVYLAAMFAGIWCMMKMFHIASQGVGSDLDNPPAAVVTAMQDVDTYEYFYELDDEDVTDLEVEKSVSRQYDDIDDFARDFGYALEPEYASIKVPSARRS